MAGFPFFKIKVDEKLEPSDMGYIDILFVFSKIISIKSEKKIDP